jgi:hypothetical protein
MRSGAMGVGRAPTLAVVRAGRTDPGCSARRDNFTSSGGRDEIGHVAVRGKPRPGGRMVPAVYRESKS